MRSLLYPKTFEGFVYRCSKAQVRTFIRWIVFRLHMSTYDQRIGLLAGLMKAFYRVLGHW